MWPDIGGPKRNGNSNGRHSGNGNGGKANQYLDEHGKFKPGNPGGPGDAMGPARERLRAALSAACTRGAINEIAEKLIAEAKAGRAWAITELFNRLFGKPRQQVDISGLPEPIKHLAGVSEQEV
jgi:hypothetical protein